MNIVIAVPVDENLAAFIGKKGSANSIAFYNRKFGSDVIVTLFPNQEEEKIHALAESLLIASEVILSTASVDKKFGEALVASSLLNRKLLITKDNDVNAMLSSAGIVNCSVVSREELLDAIQANAPKTDPNEPVRVDIDKAFPVKGIGTVVLGIVTRGTLKQHDKLIHTSGKEVTVRSMQSQDEDVAVAERGTRIGIALKELGDEDFKKGDLLAKQQVARHSKLSIEYKASKIAKEPIEEGKTYGIALNFSYSECVVMKAEGSKIELELKTKIPAMIGDELLMIRKEIPRIFASGSVKAASD